MTTIPQTRPVTPTQIFATIGIVAMAILGVTQAPTLDPVSGLIIFMVSASIILAIVTIVGLNTTWRHGTFNKFSQRVLAATKRHRATIVMAAFGLGASVAIGLYAHFLVGLTTGALVLAALVGLWLQQKRGLAIVA